MMEHGTCGVYASKGYGDDGQQQELGKPAKALAVAVVGAG